MAGEWGQRATRSRGDPRCSGVPAERDCEMTHLRGDGPEPPDLWSLCLRIARSSSMAWEWGIPDLHVRTREKLEGGSFSEPREAGEEREPFGDPRVGSIRIFSLILMFSWAPGLFACFCFRILSQQGTKKLFQIGSSQFRCLHCRFKGTIPGLELRRRLKGQTIILRDTVVSELTAISN
jgi:hypothetical protein